MKKEGLSGTSHGAVFLPKSFLFRDLPSLPGMGLSIKASSIVPEESHRWKSGFDIHSDEFNPLGG